MISCNYIIPGKCVIIGSLLFVAACGSSEISEEDVNPDLPVLNDELSDAIHSHNYQKADSLANWLINRAEETGNYEVLIDARTNKAIALHDRRYMDDAVALILENLETIEDYGLPRQEAYALVQLSNMYVTMNSQREALETVNKAVALIPVMDDPHIIAAVYATKAGVISRQNPVEALQLNYKALNMFQDVDDFRSVAIARNNIALMYHQQEDYESALDQYEVAIRLHKEYEDIDQLAITYNNTANSLSESGEKKAAADTLLKAIEINWKLGISPRLIQNYYNLAMIYGESKEYDEAYSYFSQAYEESKSINFLPGIMHHAYGLAKVNYELGEHDRVKGYIEESREIAERLENLDILADGWRLQSSLLEDIGNYKEALSAAKKVNVYTDSLDSIRREREFEEVRTAYEVDLTNAENDLLRQELSHQERYSSIQRLFLFILVVGVVFISMLLFLIFRNQRKLQHTYTSLKKKNKLISSKNRQLVTLNNELRQLNSEKDRLISIIVHDLRNPLFGVIGFLDVISESVTDEYEIEHLEMARKSAYRLNTLINSLLDVHSLEKENDYRIPEKVNTDTIIENALTAFNVRADKKGINIHTDLSGLTVDSHPSYLSRIADNLISNAIKFSHSGTNIYIKTRRVENDFWQLEVADEGPGVTDQDKKKMFQMFGKLSARPTDGEETTGLGLYTVNMLVERLDGSITVKRGSEKGSRFICKFPITQRTTPSSSDKKHSVPLPSTEKAL